MCECTLVCTQCALVLHSNTKCDILECTIVESLPNFWWAISDKFANFQRMEFELLLSSPTLQRLEVEVYSWILSVCFITQERRNGIVLGNIPEKLYTAVFSSNHFKGIDFLSNSVGELLNTCSLQLIILYIT